MNEIEKKQKENLEKLTAVIRKVGEDIAPTLFELGGRTALLNGANEKQMKMAGFSSLLSFMNACLSGVDPNSAIKGAMEASKVLPEAALFTREAVSDIKDPTKKKIAGMEIASTIISKSAARHFPRMSSEKQNKDFIVPTKVGIITTSILPNSESSKRKLKGSGMCCGGAMFEPQNTDWIFGGSEELRGGLGIGAILTGIGIGATALGLLHAAKGAYDASLPQDGATFQDANNAADAAAQQAAQDAATQEAIRAEQAKMGFFDRTVNQTGEALKSFVKTGKNAAAKAKDVAERTLGLEENPYANTWVSRHMGPLATLVTGTEVLNTVYPFVKNRIIDPHREERLKKRYIQGLTQKEFDEWVREEEGIKGRTLTDREKQTMRRNQKARIHEKEMKYRDTMDKVYDGGRLLANVGAALANQAINKNAANYIAYAALKDTKYNGWSPLAAQALSVGTQLLSKRFGVNFSPGQIYMPRGHAAAAAAVKVNASLPYAQPGDLSSQISRTTDLYDMPKSRPSTTEAYITSQLAELQKERLREAFEREQGLLLQQAQAPAFNNVSAAGPPNPGATTGLPKLLRRDEVAKINQQALSRAMSSIPGLKRISPLSQETVSGIPKMMKQKYGSLPVFQSPENPFSLDNMMKHGYKNLISDPVSFSGVKLDWKDYDDERTEKKRIEGKEKEVDKLIRKLTKKRQKLKKKKEKLKKKKRTSRRGGDDSDDSDDDSDDDDDIEEFLKARKRRKMLVDDSDDEYEYEDGNTAIPTSLIVGNTAASNGLPAIPLSF